MATLATVERLRLHHPTSCVHMAYAVITQLQMVSLRLCALVVEDTFRFVGPAMVVEIAKTAMLAITALWERVRCSSALQVTTVIQMWTYLRLALLEPTIQRTEPQALAQLGA